MEEFLESSGRPGSPEESLLARCRTLEGQRQRYKEFFDFAPDSYLVTNSDGVIQEANQAATNQLNVAHDVLVGKKLVMFVAEQDRRLFAAQLQRVKAGEVQRLEDWEVLLHPYENRPVPVAVTLGVVKAYEGRPTGLRWLFRDISERKKADEMLRRSRQQLSDFVESAAVPMYWVNEQGVILWANQAAIDLLGFARDEFIGSNIKEYHQDPAVPMELLQKLKQGEILTNHEERLCNRDGATLHALIDANVYWEGDQFIHARFFLRDITERKAAEEQILLLNTELERRVRERTAELEQINARLQLENRERQRIEEELRRLTTSISDYLWSAEVHDGKPAYLYYSPVVERITGRPPEYFMRGMRRWLETIYPPDRVRAEKAVLRLMKGESEREEEEYRILKSDGSVRWVRDSALATPLEGGGILLNGVVSDVTERKLAEQRTAMEYAVLRKLPEKATASEAIQHTLETVGAHMELDRGEFWVPGSEKELQCRQFWQAPGTSFPELAKLCRNTALPRGIGLAGRVWATGTPVVISDVSRDATFYHGREAGREGVRGAFGFPVRSGQELLGVLCFFSRHMQKPDNSLLNVYAAVGTQLGMFLERLTTMDQLRRSEEQFRKLFLSTPEPILVFSAERMVTDLNPAFERLTRFRSSEILGRPMEEITIAEDKRLLQHSMDQAVEDRKSPVFVIRLRARDQEPIVTEASISVQKRKDNTLSYMLFCRNFAPEPKAVRIPIQKVRAEPRVRAAKPASGRADLLEQLALLGERYGLSGRMPVRLRNAAGQPLSSKTQEKLQSWLQDIFRRLRKAGVRPAGLRVEIGPKILQATVEFSPADFRVLRGLKTLPDDLGLDPDQVQFGQRMLRLQWRKP